MELSKNDSKAVKGIAILGMLMLHLFCRFAPLPYTPLIWVGDTPLIYYLGLFGDICVPTYCFLSGYAQALLMGKEEKKYYKNRFLRVFKFLVNYWIVLCLFAVVGLAFDSTHTMPGSILKFLGNFFLYDISYNGAWWFVLTYVLLIAFAPLIIKISYKFNSVIVVLLSGVFYFIAYLFRFSMAVKIGNPILGKLWEELMLFGTSQFAFVIGVLFLKHEVVSKLRKLRMKAWLKSVLGIAFVFAAFVFHCFVPSLIVAPITAIVSLTCFWVCPKCKWLNKVLEFFGEHSTNAWLVHMFFYLVLFKNLVFAAKYPALILLFMLALCIATSYIVKLPYNCIVKRLGK